MKLLIASALAVTFLATDMLALTIHVNTPIDVSPDIHSLTVYNHLGGLVGAFSTESWDTIDEDDDGNSDYFRVHFEVGAVVSSGSFGISGFNSSSFTAIFDSLAALDGAVFSTISDPPDFIHPTVQTRTEDYSERNLASSDLRTGLDGDVPIQLIVPVPATLLGGVAGDLQVSGSGDFNGDGLNLGAGFSGEVRFGWKTSQHGPYFSQVRNYYQYRLASQSSSKRAIWTWETPLAQGTFTEVLKLEADGVNPPTLKLNNANVLTSANLGSSLTSLNLSGTLGVGTTTPNSSSKLHVVGSGNALIVDGNALFNNAVSASILSASYTGNSGSPAIKFGPNSQTGFYTQSGSDLQTTVGGTPVMSLSQGGTATIGIGSNASQLTLDGLSGDLSFVDGSRIETSRDTLYFNHEAARNHDFNDGQIRFTSTGKIGIGTTLPNGVLTVASNAVDGFGAPSKGVLFVSTVLAPASPFTHASIFSDGSTGFNGDLVFATDGDSANNNNATEKMRILANGNVGVGTVAPQAKLHVVGTVRFSAQGDILMGEFGTP